MKRIEMLTQVKDQVESSAKKVVSRDLLTLNNEKSKLNLEIMNKQDAIDSFLSDPKRTMDSMFISLVREKTTLEKELDLIDSIINAYL